MDMGIFIYFLPAVGVGLFAFALVMVDRLIAYINSKKTVQ